MGIGANLDVGPAGLTATDRQKISAGRADAANAAVAGREGLNFHDSWRAQVASMHPAGEAVETDAEAAASSVSQPQGRGEADIASRQRDLGAGFMWPVDAETAKRVTGSLAEPKVRKRQPAVPEGSDAGNRMNCNKAAADDYASQITVIPNEIAVSLQASPVAVSTQGAVSDITTSSAASDASNPQVVLKSETELQAGSFHSAVSTSTTAKALVEQLDHSGLADTNKLQVEYDRTNRPEEVHRFASEGGGSNRRLGASEHAPDGSFPVDPTSTIGGGTEAESDAEHAAKVEEDVRLGRELGSASSQLRPVQGVKNETGITDDFGIKNGSAAAISSEGASSSANRGAQVSTEAQILPSSAGSASFVESTKTSKSPVPRINTSSTRTSAVKQAADNSLASLAPHATVAQGNLEKTDTAMTTAKNGIPVSGNSRVEETFAALESGSKFETGESSPGRSGRLQAEAGYEDPILGWVGVRAEASRGVIHATVLSPSADAAQALSGHMAGLHTYLADHRTPVETLTLASSGSDGRHLAGQDSGRGMHQGAEQQAGRDKSESILDQQSMTRAFAGSTWGEAAASGGVVARADAENGLGGRHISIVV